MTKFQEHLALAIGTLIAMIILIVIMVWVVNTKTIEVQGAGECPVCPSCQITARSIKQNTIDYSGKRHETMTRVKLPDSINDIQIGDDIYTKVQLESIK